MTRSHRIYQLVRSSRDNCPCSGYYNANGMVLASARFPKPTDNPLCFPDECTCIFCRVCGRRTHREEVDALFECGEMRGAELSKHFNESGQRLYVGDSRTGLRYVGVHCQDCGDALMNAWTPLQPTLEPPTGCYTRGGLAWQVSLDRHYLTFSRQKTYCLPNQEQLCVGETHTFYIKDTLQCGAAPRPCHDHGPFDFVLCLHGTPPSLLHVTDKLNPSFVVNIPVRIL